MRAVIYLVFTFLTLHSTFSQNSQNVESLPNFNVYKKRISLSGFSSGGTFAQMFQISHSSLIHGIAVFSHTYYRCGPPTGRVDDYDRVCTKLFNLTGNQLYNRELVHGDIANYFQQGWIDNPANLRNRFLYVYTGLRNFLFSADQSLSILSVYERYIKSPFRIKTRVQDAELNLPTNNPFGSPCTGPSENTSFIGNCGFSGAYEAIYHIHGIDHNVKDTSGSSKQTLAQQLKEGGIKHIENSGFLEVAEASDIIMIFPQAALSEPENDIGCWDTFGISGPRYGMHGFACLQNHQVNELVIATKQGDQIQAIKRMLDRAIGNTSPPSPTSSVSFTESPPTQMKVPASTSNGGRYWNWSISKGPYGQGYHYKESGFSKKNGEDANDRRHGYSSSPSSNFKFNW